MASAAAEKEMAEAARLFAIAMAGVGIKSTQQTLELWAAVPVAKKAPSRAWFDKVVDQAQTNRATTRAIAMAYYRLVRALAIGRTVPPPPGGDFSTPTLNSLRAEFRKQVRPHVAPETLNAARLTKPSKAGTEDAEGRVVMADDEIPVDDLEGRDQDIEANDKEKLEGFETVGPKVVDLQSRMSKIDEERDARSVDKDREKIHTSAGVGITKGAEWLTLNAGRNVVAANIEHDDAAIGWIRISTTGTPCEFCAMLMTRGFVRNESFSKAGADLEYHPNCHCVAVPVFNLDWKDNPLFDLNRYYAEQWPKVTKGLSGDAAIAAWRKWIRNRAGQEPPTTQQSTQEVVDVEEPRAA